MNTQQGPSSNGFSLLHVNRIGTFPFAVPPGDGGDVRAVVIAVEVMGLSPGPAAGDKPRMRVGNCITSKVLSTRI